MQLSKCASAYLIFGIRIASAYAEKFAELQPWLESLEKTVSPLIQPKLPRLPLRQALLPPTLINNLFAPRASLNGNAAASSGAASDYSLSQLQMVGYLYYKQVEYSFIRTPSTTIKVKVGDKVGRGVVRKISPKLTEIDEVQISQHNQYVNRVFLELLPSAGSPALR